MIIHFNAIQHENRFYFCDFEILKVTTQRFIDFIFADCFAPIGFVVWFKSNWASPRKSNLDPIATKSWFCSKVILRISAETF